MFATGSKADITMQSMIKLTLVLAGATLLGTQPALGETLRCGSALIQPGDDASYVLENCGAPASDDSDAALESGIHVYQIGMLRADRWRYHRGPGLFPAIVTIADDGRVADIQFEHDRD
jgi:uncharacterized protein DUF2845